jgi:hypothetical protein
MRHHRWWILRVLTMQQEFDFMKTKVISVEEEFDNFDDAIYWLGKYLDEAVSVADAEVTMTFAERPVLSKNATWIAFFSGTVNG